MWCFLQLLKYTYLQSAGPFLSIFFYTIGKANSEKVVKDNVTWWMTLMGKYITSIHNFDFA
jgi:hypothetical protein